MFILHVEMSGQLRCNSRFFGPGVWGGQGSEQKTLLWVSGWWLGWVQC